MILSVEERAVLSCMKKWSDDCKHYGYEEWRRYERLSRETRIEIEMLKKVMKSLRKKQLVYRSATVNGDGMLNGSGYFLTTDEE